MDQISFTDAEHIGNRKNIRREVFKKALKALGSGVTFDIISSPILLHLDRPTHDGMVPVKCNA